MAPRSSTFCLENPVDGGALWAAVYGVARVGHDWASGNSEFYFFFSNVDSFYSFCSLIAVPKTSKTMLSSGG